MLVPALGRVSFNFQPWDECLLHELYDFIAKSSSIILVIRDGIINETNYIVDHVFVDISRSHGCKNVKCQNEKLLYILTLYISVAISQRLFRCFGLFIPLALANLRLMNCVEVQRSVRHIQDHIQSIEVLNCSSIDLHILCVCLVLGLAYYSLCS
jgi:hypothetical protein